MKGKFKTSPTKYLSCAIFLAIGIAMAVQFAVWGAERLSVGLTSTAIFCFCFAVMGLLAAAYAVYSFVYNRGASLTVENGELDLRFGFNRHLHTRITNLSSAEISGKNLILFIGADVITVSGLVNARDVYTHIRSLMPRGAFNTDAEEARAIVAKTKRPCIAYLTATVALLILMICSIAVCVVFTGGKELNEFGETENTVFTAFAAIEILTVVATFFVADKCGKRFLVLNHARSAILSAEASARKAEGLDSALEVKYFNHCLYRIVISATPTAAYSYMLQRFDSKTLSWKSCYPRPRSFDDLSELKSDIEYYFEDVFFED